MAAMSESNTEAVYRRMSDTRVARDRNRARQWREANAHIEEGIDESPHHLSELNADASPFQYDEHIENRSGNIKHMDNSTHLGQPQNVNHSDDNICASAQTNVVLSSPSQQCNTAGISGVHSAESQQVASALSREPSQDSVMICESGLKQHVNNKCEVEIACSVCHKACNSNGNRRWFKCTICDDFDICRKCQHSHTHHKAYIHNFTYPEQSDYKAYCDSCGVVFEDDEMNVNKCNVCQDYALCSDCKNAGMHSKHGVFRELSLITYLESDYSDDSVDIEP